MKSVLISIQPKWCDLIAYGEKTIEVRKTRPKIETPFKCYIYQTKAKQVEHCDGCDITYYGNGKVIGEFVCDRIYSFIFLSTDGGNADRRRQYYLIGENDKIIRKFWRESCIQPEELAQYIDQEESCYGWHISDLKIYDKLKRLGEFLTPSGTGGVWGNHYLSRPPQSWCYVEE